METATKQIASEIRAEMAKKKVIPSVLALELGWSRSTVYSRINGSSAWTIDEIVTASNFLKIDPAFLVRQALA